MEKGLLSVKGLSKHFGGVKAVDDVDFITEKGSIHGLIGPNGSGKTTFMNLLTGIYLPTHGSIRFKGEEIVGLPSHVITKKGISRTFQNLRLFNKMTVLENVFVGRHLSINYSLFSSIIGTNRRVEALERDKALTFLEFVGLADKANTISSDLPYGDQRLVEIARALAVEPDMLLLDEPLAGMNKEECNKVVSYIYKIREKGITIILVEHSVRIVLSVSDRISVLNFGKKIAEGDAYEISNNKEVITAYLGTRGQKDADNK